MTLDELVAEVKAAGIDIDSADSRIARWVNRLIREAAVESGWLRGTPQVALTTANLADYSVPATVARIRDLRVGAGDPYDRVSAGTIWRLNSGRLQQSLGSPGLFAESYSDDGTVKSVTLWPTPVTSGDAIEADAVLYPADITGGNPSPLPVEFDVALVHGVIALGISFGDEDNNSAVFHQQAFEQGKEKLRRLANSRFSSSGGSRVLVHSYDFV